jgi:hypothetical protein
MCLSGVAWAKEILDICSTLDRVTSNDGEVEKQGAIVMCRSYVGYKRGKEKLAAAGYFCLTVFQKIPQNRRDASRRYQIDFNILAELGKLTSERGGKDSRKAEGVEFEYSETERNWIDKVLLILIRRIADYACDPGASMMRLTRNELFR